MPTIHLKFNKKRGNLPISKVEICLTMAPISLSVLT